MQISERARRIKPSATLSLNAKIKAMKAAGEDLVGFGAGQPDFDTPDIIKQAAADALAAGRTGYEPVPGPPEVREAIARKLRTENGIECAAGDVVVSSGAKHSMYLTLQAMLEPGDEVILLTPAWLSYRPMVELAGGSVVEVPGATDNDFKVTPDELQAAITERTAALILNSPSNPCGTMYAPEDIRSLVEVVAAHPRIAIISDEIYEKLVYTDIGFLSPGSLPEIADRVVTINGLSKAYAMTGWRLGYLAAPGDGGALASAVARLQGHMTSNVTSFSYPAIVTALERGAEAVESMRRTFAQRAAIIHELVGRWPGVRCPRPTGAFYVFPDMSAFMGSTSPAGRAIDSVGSLADALLEEAKVAVVPGEDFGACARNHVRLSFACGEATIREGCARIEGWLATLKQMSAV